MKSSRDRVIKGASVDGVVFCSPNGKLENLETLERREQEQLKTLEDFWLSKGLQEGQQAGFDEGYKEGESEGYRKGRREGQKEGFDEGLQKGLEDGREEGRISSEETLKEELALLQSLSKELSEKQAELIEHNRSEIIRFALSVSEVIIRRELKDPDSFADLIEGLIQQAAPVVRESLAHIYLNPEDLQMLQVALDRLSISPEQRDLLSFQSDNSIRRGDCRLEAPMGLLNFDVARQVASIEHRVLEVTKDSNAETEG